MMVKIIYNSVHGLELIIDFLLIIQDWILESYTFHLNPLTPTVHQHHYSLFMHSCSQKMALILKCLNYVNGLKTRPW